ncbi:MAG: arylsulfatase [Verrucomicrobia bacterium]|nr:arylsulfatase [Verrucomicrobiota bacterium]
MKSALFRPLLLAWLLCIPWFSAAATKPNIIYLLADDLGYGDLGSYGQKLIRTPRLDAMAKQGLRFTDHYSGAPSCHPSRCALFTGKHTGHGFIRNNSKIPLRPEDFTLSQMLKQAGYATGGIGKWALGDGDTTGAPWKKGMDEFFGYLDQTHAHGYYPDFLWRDGQRVDIPQNKNGKRAAYSHDLFVDFALDFIKRHKGGPFFFYGAFTIPHAEVTVPEDSLAEYRGRWPEPKKFEGSKTYCPQDQPRAVRAAMVTRLDRDVGRILDLLDELKLSENTLVIFTSDNGPIGAGGQDPEFFDSNGPLRDLKFTLREGGIRVPCLARWPGKVPAGATTDFPSAFWDMIPTLAELTGVSAPTGLDGVSILPTLLGQRAKQKPRDHLYWETAPAQALRQGHWKAYRAAPGRPLELYNLADDLGETRDVAKENPALVAKYETLLSQAHAESAEFPLAAKSKKGKQP